jgi:arsenate reductase
MRKKAKVLFLSTGNSTRSQIAEGFLRTLAGNDLLVSSAGIKTASADPLANEVMTEVGIDIGGQHSKNVAEALKEHFGYVITLYDSTKERSPIFPFTPHLLQWDVPDPNAKSNSAVDRREAFRRVRDEIHAHIEAFLNKTHEVEHDYGVFSYV